MKSLWIKYKPIIAYIFFGICTTVVNLVTYYVFVQFIGVTILVGTCIAWVLAVLFAYVSNRKWVFKSEASGRIEVLRELFSFFICRIATGLLDIGFMFVFVVKMKFYDLAINIKLSGNYFELRCTQVNYI